ncbi:MAG TPA: MG2 domain-containing protein [Anaerolineaceae bacterium]|nr:MG2 domain-containing protein [Anaerolineaceae bacterium]HPN50554.1 MG2 domain-containing protein [Anaerolineaceae bacterium]
MSRKTLVNMVLALLLIAALGSAIGLTVHYTRLPEYQTDHNLMIFGQSSLTPGTQAGLRLVAQNAYTRASLADVDFTVSMRPAAGGEAVVLFTGKTGPDGSANINFKVPESADPNQILRVESHSAANTSQVERPVTLKRDYRLLLSTDKPIYQPGQIIHLRLLALSLMDLAPANAQELELTIADGKGNRVMRQKVKTSEYGVASLDFQLASEVNSGNYKITATLNNTSSEKTVTVEPYVLPKFRFAFAADKTFYLPGETVKGSLDAAYFFGKPVSGSEVRLEVFSYDVQKNVVASLQGTTDEMGRFTFSFDLPGYLTGSEWDQGRGRVYLEAMITDQANHSETGQYSLPVSQQPLVIQAVPEGGVVRPGQATSIYVMTSYPDGTPASASIKLADSDEPVQTGPYGIAVLADPQGRESVTITAEDDRGNQAAQTFVFSANYNSGGVVLRTDKPIYRVGETMKVTIYSGNSQSVYLDIIRNGQTVSTRAMTPAQGKADDAIDLTPDLWGTLELHAYFLDKYGSIYRDTRLVVVDQANELSVTLMPKNDSYRPGDTAQVDVQVNDDQGSGLQSALGLAVVDEAVFALAQQDPGFARLYFMLEEELMTPKIDLHDYSFQDLVAERPANPQLEKAANLAAEASLASAAGDLLMRSGQIHSLVANSWAETSQKVYQQQRDFFSRASGILLIGFLLIPIGIAALAVVELWQQKVFGRSLGTALAALACFFLVGWVLSILSSGRPFDSPLNFLGDLMDAISRQDEPVLLGFLLLTLAGFIALVVIAVARKEILLGWSMGLLGAYILTGGLLVYSISASSLPTPPDWVIIAVLVAFLLTPLVFWVRTMGFVFQKRTAAVLACLPVTLFMTVGFLPMLMMTSGGHRRR